MSEKTPQHHNNYEGPQEHEPIHEADSSHESQPRHEREAREQKNHEELRKSREEALERATEEAEKHSLSSEEVDSNIHEKDPRVRNDNLPANPQLKSHARDQGFRKIRRQLSPKDRLFSRTIHQPLVEATSEVAEQTIARPSGLLAGGMFSLFSSGGVLFIAKYYGYEYNFFVGLATFVIGFFVGILLEFLIRLFRRSKN